MKNMFFVLILMASPLSFAAFMPQCQSGDFDKWGNCADDSPAGQFSHHVGIAYCLKPCSQSFAEMVEQAQADAQKYADNNRNCGFNNVRSSDWTAPLASEIVEGSRAWVKIQTGARFTCER